MCVCMCVWVCVCVWINIVYLSCQVFSKLLTSNTSGANGANTMPCSCSHDGTKSSMFPYFAIYSVCSWNFGFSRSLHCNCSSRLAFSRNPSTFSTPAFSRNPSTFMGSRYSWSQHFLIRLRSSPTKGLTMYLTALLSQRGAMSHRRGKLMSRLTRSP